MGKGRSAAVWTLGAGAGAFGLIAVALAIWGAVLVVIGTQPCDPDQMCEGLGLFLGIVVLGAAACGAIVAAVLGVTAFLVHRGGRATARS